MSEYICTLCNHYSKTDEQNERHEATDAHRIATLEAQNKKLVEALGTTNAALIVTADDLSLHGGYAGDSVYKIVTDSRALLSEVTK